MTPPRGRVGSRVGRGARLPEPQEAHPVLRRPALEAHVGGEHRVASIAARVLRVHGGGEGDVRDVEPADHVDAEELFVRFFLPLYPPDARADLARARATDANPAGNPALLAHLDDAANRFVANAPALFERRPGARPQRRERAPPERGAHAPSARDAWAAQRRAGHARERRSSTRSCTARRTSAPASSRSTAACGACAGRSGRASCASSRAPARPTSRSSTGGSSRSPTRPTGVQAATLADRYRAHVEVPCARPEELPVVSSSGARALPRLKKPTLRRSCTSTLRAHLPELRDLGRGLPRSPSGSTAFALHVDRLPRRSAAGAWSLLAGASPAGAAPLLADGGGFEKSAFFPCDASRIRSSGWTPIASSRMTSDQGETREHEMLWWGP